MIQIAKFKDTTVTSLNATGDITVQGRTVYHTGRKPTADEIGASKLTFGSNQPGDGYWFKQIEDISDTNQLKVNVELTPHPYSLALHPITNSNAVVMQNGKNLQTEIDELKQDSGNSEELDNIVQEMNSVISTLRNEITALNNKVNDLENNSGSNACPFPVGSLFYTDATSNPSTTWPGTAWTKIEDAYMVATGSNFSTSSGVTSGGTSFTLSTANIPSHNHSFSTSSQTVSFQVQTSTSLPGYMLYSSGGGMSSSNISGRAIPYVYSASSYNLGDSGYDEMRMYSGSSYITIEDTDWFSNTAETSGPFSGSGSGSITINGTSSSTGSTGSTSAITYKPKYRTVHVWKRTS